MIVLFGPACSIIAASKVIAITTPAVASVA